ncbi:TPA: hypothetical protein ACJJ1H_004683 [Enterobacter kobei]
MVNVLVFLDNAPPKTLRLSGFRNEVKYLHVEGRVRKMMLEITFATYLNGKSGAILLISDRHVGLEELLKAHFELITGKNKKSY